MINKKEIFMHADFYPSGLETRRKFREGYTSIFHELSLIDIT